MSATVRTCAYDGAVYAMGEACPTCGARHSTADLALERLNAQIDLDGREHQIAPAHERLKLFEPAPEQMPGQESLGDLG